MSFADFFQCATGNKEPYGYQCRLACGSDADPAKPETLTDGTGCASRLISIPTGLGKTAAVVLAWLWNRVALGNEGWPRRLVYCLPMRTLVEQTRDEVARWLDALLNEYPGNPDLEWLAKYSPVILMGGEENDPARREWDIHPEKPAILIGTQDMLLSRALNRGYGMSRARWPMHFGLLNNDALWVMDETQLMGPGLWTSTQLDWLRNDRFKPLQPCATWWLSATIGKNFLETKDRVNALAEEKLMPLAPAIEIQADEAKDLDILQARRPVELWTPLAVQGKKKAKKTDEKPREIFLAALAQSICDEHHTNTLSLVVCNNVATAQELFRKIQQNGDNKPVLLTSRFRPQDRSSHLCRLLDFENARKKAVREETTCEHPGLICVSTQVVEAGVDISARRLWTELAPWPSMLQRIGRLNRDAKMNREAKVLVFEVPLEKTGNKKTVPIGPYAVEDITEAKKIVSLLAEKCAKNRDASIRTILAELSTTTPISSLIEKSLQAKPEPFPRAFDVHGLFSTEPDAFGGFTDVSPWVRGADPNTDVTVFWRDWDETKNTLVSLQKNSELSGPVFQRDEGCSVAVYKLRKFLEDTKTAYVWNDKADKWEFSRAAEICPGMVILLPAKNGGYSETLGWKGEKKDKLTGTQPPGPFDAEGDRDKLTETRAQWVTLESHLSNVASEMNHICKTLTLPTAQHKALVHAAMLHDIGKSFPKWQDALPGNRPDMAALWAKAPRFAKRPGMRHEAASALAAWHRKYRARSADFPALSIYLVAAHHGLVRTVLTSRAKAPQPNIAGIPITDPPPILPWGAKSEESWPLDFICEQDGVDGTFSEDADGNIIFTPTAPSWTALVTDLLGGWEAAAPQAAAGAVPSDNADEPHSLNPFNLAWLETLLRAVDCRISASETGIPEQNTPQADACKEQQ